MRWTSAPVPNSTYLNPPRSGRPIFFFPLYKVCFPLTHTDLFELLSRLSILHNSVNLQWNSWLFSHCLLCWQSFQADKRTLCSTSTIPPERPSQEQEIRKKEPQGDAPLSPLIKVLSINSFPICQPQSRPQGKGLFFFGKSFQFLWERCRVHKIQDFMTSMGICPEIVSE